MRLLHIEDDGGFSLVEYFGEDIPRYAILSHTWGADNEEVSYRDLTDGTGNSKRGYYKLAFCRGQAARDGLRFIWVDTCCIDKSSSTELSEAINSMFQWYQKAIVCYVYLSDVSTHGSARRIWRPAFQHSRWFTRGWTLQELLAPSSLDFFSKEGVHLGNRSSLLQEIFIATGIPTRALSQASPLSSFSVAERMEWAKNRDTKREEDAAYCLLGIFGVHIPLIYGEGKEHALSRLKREIATDYRPTVTSTKQQMQIPQVFPTAPMAEHNRLPMRARRSPGIRKEYAAIPFARDEDSATANQQDQWEEFGGRRAHNPETNTHAWSPTQPPLQELQGPRSLIQQEGEQDLQNHMMRSTPYGTRFRIYIPNKYHNPAVWEDGWVPSLGDLSRGQFREVSSRTGYSSAQEVLKKISTQIAYGRLEQVVDEQYRTANRWRRSDYWFNTSVELQWKSYNLRLRTSTRIVVTLQVEEGGSLHITDPCGCLHPYPNCRFAHFIEKENEDPDCWERNLGIPQDLEPALIAKELRNFWRSGYSFEHILRAIPSRAAAVFLDGMLTKQNQVIQHMDPDIHWIFASVKLSWKHVDHESRQLEQTEVALRADNYEYPDW